MSFQQPLALVGLAVVPLLVALAVLRERRRRAFTARFAAPPLLPNLVGQAPGVRRHLPLAVLLVALAAMIVGVARPHATVTVRREEATVILAVDHSRSMGATDVSPTRLDAAKAAATAFLARVPKKFRVGVVTFTSRAVVTVPPTADRSLVAAGLAALHPGEGTALGDAILLAAQLGQRQRASDGTVPPTSVLLISDGAQDGGRTTVAAAVQKARSLHVPVYTIVVGTANGIVTATLPGGLRELIHVPPSPQTLQQVAKSTGAQTFSVLNDTRLRDVYEGLASRLGHRSENREITDLFAAGSIVLLLAGGGLSMTWFRRVV